MKKILILTTLLCIIFTNNEQLCSAPIKNQGKVIRSEGGLFGLYNYTMRAETWGWDGVRSVHTVDLTCTGNGFHFCPSATISNGGEGGAPDSYVEQSTDMMNTYVENQRALGYYSGSTSFNDVNNGQSYYRSVVWEGNSSSVEFTMMIIPYN